MLRRSLVTKARRYNPDDNHLRTHRRENLKSHQESLEITGVAASTVYYRSSSSQLTRNAPPPQLRWVVQEYNLSPQIKVATCFKMNQFSQIRKGIRKVTLETTADG
jgi:hypothetical protein